MTFSETSHGLDTAQPVGQESRERTHIDTKQALDNLDQEVLWQDIPRSAQDYLKAKCAANLDQIPYALDYLRTTKAAEFGGLANIPEAFLPIVLGQCITATKGSSEIAALDSVEKTLDTESAALDSAEKAVDTESVAIDNEIEAETTRADKTAKRNEQHRTMINVLRNDVVAAGEGKQGYAQIQAAQIALERGLGTTAASLPPEEKEKLRAWLSGIATTLDRMTTLVEPTEQEAFTRVVAFSTFNLAGANPADQFANLMANVDASDELSDTTKAKLRVQGLGVASIRNANQLQTTLAALKKTDGHFRNDDKQVVKFGEDNGIPVGRYTVYPDPQDHSEYMATAHVGGRELRVPFSLDDDPSHLDRIMKAAMVSQVMANRDFQGANRYILGGNGLAAQGVSEIRLDEVQVARAERLYGAFMGLGTVLETGFPSESDLSSFEWRLQSTHIDGDAKTNDNTGRGDLSWKSLGMLQGGQLNMERVEEIGACLNTKSLAIPNYQALLGQFGEPQQA